MNEHDKANVIREMIRHEDLLLLGRTNLFLTLEGLLFAALGLAWRVPLLPYVFAVCGAGFALLFWPYLSLSERSIQNLIAWWNANNSGYDGPPIMGHQDLPGASAKVLPWTLFPWALFFAWVAAILVQVFVGPGKP